jgi:hypothetical protein
MNPRLDMGGCGQWKTIILTNDLRIDRRLHFLKRIIHSRLTGPSKTIFWCLARRKGKDLWREHAIRLFLIETMAMVRESYGETCPPSRMWSIVARTTDPSAKIGISIKTAGGLRISGRFRERRNVDVTSKLVGDWKDCGLLGKRREGWHRIFRRRNVTVFGCLALPRFKAESHKTLLLIFVFGGRRGPAAVLSILSFLPFLLLFGGEFFLSFPFFLYFLPFFLYLLPFLFCLLLLLSPVFIRFGGFREELIQMWSFTEFSGASKGWRRR